MFRDMLKHVSEQCRDNYLENVLITSLCLVLQLIVFVQILCALFFMSSS